MSEARREPMGDTGASITTDDTHTWQPFVRALAITAVLTGLAWMADGWVYARWHDPKVYDEDWGRLLRVIGFLGTWLALAVAIALQEGADPARRALAKRRAAFLFWSAALGGIVAEVGKLTIRRERPQPHDGVHVFRDWGERTWSSAGLAMPSSHTLVAFAGAAMLARLYPRARWVGYALAAGCGLTRVLARAHFLSDVVLAAGLGWMVAFMLARRTRQIVLAAFAFVIAARGLEAQSAPAESQNVFDVRLVRTYNDQGSMITSVAYSPDSRWLATGSSDKTVRLLEARSGLLLRELTGHRGGITSVAFSANGRWLASGSADSSVRIWDTETGMLVRALTGLDWSVTSLAFSPDGQRLSTLSGDGRLRVWEIVALGPVSDQAYFDFQVDKKAVLIPGSGDLRYPASLRRSGVEGEVLAQFVVDTLGRVELQSLKVIRSSDPMFEAAVREALPKMRFVPAEVAGRRVKQLIQEPFVFSLGR